MNTSSSQKNQPDARALRRPIDGRILGGVAAGLARRYTLDVVIIRIALVALSLLGGAGVPLYLGAWILIPAEGSGGTLADDMLSHAGRHLSPARITHRQMSHLPSCPKCSAASRKGTS